MKNIKTRFDRNDYYFHRDSKLRRSDFEDEDDGDGWLDDTVAIVLMVVLLLVLAEWTL